MKKRKLFCERGPVCCAISLGRTIAMRHLKNFCGGEKFAVQKEEEPLRYLVKFHQSPILRRLAGVDMDLQLNKKVNLGIAGGKLSGVLIHPGEMFSFWKLVGNPTAKDGYLEGLTIQGGKACSGVGGGLCQLANLVHWMVLHSPLTVTELHHHTDALFPDSNRRVPFGTGTSVFYNALDYRFLNETGDTYQLRVWLDGGDLCGELNCSAELLHYYRIEERDHHYTLEEDGYYRNSEIWRLKLSRTTNGVLEELLIFTNHSKVLYDPSLIPCGQRPPESPTQRVVESCQRAMPAGKPPRP